MLDANSIPDSCRELREHSSRIIQSMGRGEIDFLLSRSAETALKLCHHWQ